MTSTSMYEPRPPRFGVHHFSTLVRADGTQLRVTMMNISQAGFGLKLAGTLLDDEEVILRGVAGDVPAKIRWALGNHAGGIFLRPADD